MSYTQALGKVSIVGKGTWSNALAYDKLDVVKHNGGSYIALQNVPAGTLITDTAYWMSIVDKGEKGDTGSTGATGNGVASIAKTGTSGLVDTYTVTYTNGQTMTYTITNGADGVGIVSVEKTATSGNVDTYTILFTNGTTTTYLVTNGSVTSVNGNTGDVVIDTVENANNANWANNLNATIYNEDKEPYGFRTTGGVMDVGEKELKIQLTGGSVVWNQLVQNGDFSNGKTGWSGTNALTLTAADNVLTVTCSGETIGSTAYITQTVPQIAGHKYLMTCCIKSNKLLEFRPSLGVSANIAHGNTTTLSTANTWQNVYGIVSAPETGSSTRMYYYLNRNSVLATNDTVNIKTANMYDLTLLFGSTIADYIYSLEQNTAGAGVAWFKKLFPKDYYAYNAGALLSVKTSAHKTVGFNAYNPETGKAKLCGGKEYQITGTYTNVSYTNINGETETLTIDSNGKFTPLADGLLTVAGGNSTDTCVHTVWSGYMDGAYKPYEEHTYAFDDDLELRGIPKIDASGKLYYDGDTYTADGTVTRNYEYRAYASGDESLTDAITDGTHTVAKLTTPTTESADPYTETQLCDDYGTEEFIDERAVSIPVGHITHYPANLRDKIQHLPDLAGSDGIYLIHQTDENMALQLYNAPTGLPEAPTTDGTYTLKCTVTDGTAVYSWIAD